MKFYSLYFTIFILLKINIILNKTVEAETSEMNEINEFNIQSKCLNSCNTCHNTLYFLKIHGKIDCRFTNCPETCLLLTNAYFSNQNYHIKSFIDNNISSCDSCFRLNLCHVEECIQQDKIIKFAIQKSINSFPKLHLISHEDIITKFNIINKRTEDYYFNLDLLIKNVNRMMNDVQSFMSLYEFSDRLKMIYLNLFKKLKKDDYDLNQDEKINFSFNNLSFVKYLDQIISIKNLYENEISKNKIKLFIDKVYDSDEFNKVREYLKQYEDIDFKIKLMFSDVVKICENFRNGVRKNILIIKNIKLKMYDGVGTRKDNKNSELVKINKNDNSKVIREVPLTTNLDNSNKDRKIKTPIKNNYKIKSFKNTKNDKNKNKKEIEVINSDNLENELYNENKILDDEKKKNYIPEIHMVNYHKIKKNIIPHYNIKNKLPQKYRINHSNENELKINSFSDILKKIDDKINKLDEDFSTIKNSQNKNIKIKNETIYNNTFYNKDKNNKIVELDNPILNLITPLYSNLTSEIKINHKNFDEILPIPILDNLTNQRENLIKNSSINPNLNSISENIRTNLQSGNIIKNTLDKEIINDKNNKENKLEKLIKKTYNTMKSLKNRINNNHNKEIIYIPSTDRIEKIKNDLDSPNHFDKEKFRKELEKIINETLLNNEILNKNKTKEIDLPVNINNLESVVPLISKNNTHLKKEKTIHDDEDIFDFNNLFKKLKIEDKIIQKTKKSMEYDSNKKSLNKENPIKIISNLDKNLKQLEKPNRELKLNKDYQIGNTNLDLDFDKDLSFKDETYENKDSKQDHSIFPLLFVEKSIKKLDDQLFFLTQNLYPDLIFY